MRLHCPNCEAGYEVAAHLIEADGRLVRCSACGHVWRAERPQPAPAATTVADPAPPAPPPPPAAEGTAPAERFSTPAFMAPRKAGPAPLTPAQPADIAIPPRDPPPEVMEAPRAGAAVWTGWVATVIVLVAGATAAVHYRTDIMAIWPPSQWVYAALGLNTP